MTDERMGAAVLCSAETLLRAPVFSAKTLPVVGHAS